MLFPLSYVRKWYARLESNQRPLPSQSSALSAELRAQEEEPPAGVEPAPRPYKGRVLAVDTTEAGSGDGRSRTDIFLGASEALVQLSYIPGKVRTGGVEPPQREATGLRPAELAGARRPHDVRVAGRARTGACGVHDLGCFRLHHGHHERERPDSNRRPLA